MIFGPEFVTQFSKARSINNCHCQNPHWQLELHTKYILKAFKNYLILAPKGALGVAISVRPPVPIISCLRDCFCTVKKTGIRQFPRCCDNIDCLSSVSEPCHVCLMHWVYTALTQLAPGAGVAGLWWKLIVASISRSWRCLAPAPGGGKHFYVEALSLYWSIRSDSGLSLVNIER